MGRFYGKKVKKKKIQNLLYNNNRNCRCRGGGGGVDRQGENTHRGLQQRPIMTLPFFSLLGRFFFTSRSDIKLGKKKTFYLFIYRKNAKLFLGPGLPAVVLCVPHRNCSSCVYLRNGDRTEFMTTPIFLALFIFFFFFLTCRPQNWKSK